MASYHVATGGNDADAGTELAPFKTISKLVSSVDTAGDNAFLNRGDTWTGESLAESTDGTNGSHITYDVYGSGNKPVLDYNWNSPGNFTGIVNITGDYIDINNIRAIKAGPQSSGQNSGGLCFNIQSATNVVVTSCEGSGAWRGVFRFKNATTCTVDGGSWDDAGWSEQSGHDWPTAVSASDSDSSVFKNLTIQKVFGEGLGSRESDTVTFQDCEIFAAKQAGCYIDVGANCVIQRLIIYGTTDSTYHRTTGYSGHGLLQNVESFHSSETQLNDNHWSLCLVAFCWSGFRLADQKVGVLQDGLEIQHCTLIDNKDQWQFNYNTPSPSTPNLIRNNIMFPITAGTSLSAGTVRSSGITWDYNYWHGGGEDANLTGSNDPSGTVTLTKTSGWQALATLGDVSGTDFRPSSGLTTTDLGFDDYFGVADIDEVGAILETDTTPPAVGIGGGVGNPGFPGNVKLVLT